MEIKIAVLASGSGSNLQSIIDAIDKNYIQNAKIICVISNNKDAFALERAKTHNIKAIFLDKSNKSKEEFTNNLIVELKHYKIDLICLAGFTLILSNIMFKKNNFKNKVINIHPSLLPEFGGEGMYGINVHKSVYNAKKYISGATVHFVNEICDGGEIILQQSIDIKNCTSPEEIREKVLEIEHKIYPEAINIVIKSILE